MCKLFDVWESDIRTYCNENGLDFQKVKTFPKSWGKDNIFFHYCDPDKGKAGLRDETPARTVLKVFIENGSPHFEQTEYTKQYLSQKNIH